MNRDSHSDATNMFDQVEFDYDIWKDCFELVFKETGYTEHYCNYMKDNTICEQTKTFNQV